MRTATRTYHQTARAESAEATGRHIAQAFLARLMEHWFDEITLDQVAEDAGVTVQTVVRRFGGKEGLLATAARVMGDQIIAQRTAPPGDIDTLLEKLIGDYERTGDAVIRLLALEPRQPTLKKLLDFGRSKHRKWVSDGFAGSLSHLDPASRQRTIDALVIITDVYTWKLLRRDMARSIRATAETMKNLIHATLTQSVKAQNNNEIE